MRFSVSLLCLASLASCAFVGSDKFAPKRSAEVIFLADATTSNNIFTYTMRRVRRDFPDLFEAYKKTKHSLKVGFHITGAQNGRCWIPKMTLTDDLKAILKGLDGTVTDPGEVSMTPDFWNKILSMVDANTFSVDPPIRRVVVLMSEKTPDWGTGRASLSLTNCNNSIPEADQFRIDMRRRDVGFLYSAENMYSNVTVRIAAQMTELMEKTQNPDVKVVSQLTYPPTGSGTSIVPALAEMLSEDWIQSKSFELWPGFESFAPKQSAEVLFLADSTTADNILSYSVWFPRASMATFFDAYKKKGLTVKVGLHITGAQDAKCWKPKLDLSDDVAIIKRAFGGYFTSASEVNKEPNFWNTVLYLAASDKFTGDDGIRRVIVVMSEKTPAWGTKVTQPDMSSIECGHPSPTAKQFKKIMEKRRIALLYAAEHVEASSTVKIAAAVSKLITATGMTDWKAVSKDASTGRSIMPGLAEVLSPEWIATTTTTLTPEEVFVECVQECVPCDSDSD